MQPAVHALRHSSNANSAICACSATRISAQIVHSLVHQLVVRDARILTNRLPLQSPEDPSAPMLTFSLSFADYLLFGLALHHFGYHAT